MPGQRKSLSQFGMRDLLFAMVFVAIVLGMYLDRHRLRRQVADSEQREKHSQSRQVELEQEVARLLGYNFYTDEFAEELKQRAAELSMKNPASRRRLPADRQQILEFLRVDADRLPIIPSARNEEMRALSPRYALIFTIRPTDPQTVYSVDVSGPIEEERVVPFWMRQANELGPHAPSAVGGAADRSSTPAQ